jgi:hypothetical protein
VYAARKKYKAPRVSVTAFSVPCASIALAVSIVKGQPEHQIFMGLSDGTLMRLHLFYGHSLNTPDPVTKWITVFPRLFILQPLQPTDLQKGEESSATTTTPHTGKDGGDEPKALSKTSLSSVPPSAETVLKFDQEGVINQLKQSYPGYTISLHPFGDGGHMRYSGESFPLLRIVVKGQRAVVSGTAGIFVFKLDKQPGDKERVVHMQLSENSGFDFRGGILAILKHDTSIQMLNMNTHKLEVEMEKYSPGPGKGGMPSYAGGHVPVVRIHDERIVFFHADGSLRAMEYVDTTHLNSPYETLKNDDAGGSEKKSREHSFLPSNTRGGKNKTKTNKNKKNPKKK